MTERADLPKWGALWSLMDPTRGTRSYPEPMDPTETLWIETTHAMFWHMLEVLPPIYLQYSAPLRLAFCCSEPHCDDPEGRNLYCGMAETADGRYFAKYTNPHRWATHDRKQLHTQLNVQVTP